MNQKLRRIFFLILAACPLLLVGCDYFRYPRIHEWYVSPEGDDNASGSPEEPFATLTAALSAARMTPSGHTRTIYLKTGSYYDVHIVLTAADSNLSIASAPGEKPILFGGQQITRWKQNDRFITASLDSAGSRGWFFRTLLVNGEIRPRTRLPETGAFTHKNRFDVRWLGATGGGWERKPVESELTTLTYHAKDIGPWLDVRNAELTIYHVRDESLVGLASLDNASRTLTFSTPAAHPPGAFSDVTDKAATYVLWNIREGMKHPGQWYLDRTAGELVYWPLPGETIGSIQAVAPVTGTVIRLEKGARNITIDGLTIRCTTTPLKAGGFGAGAFDGAITCEGGDHCCFQNLTVEQTGGWGLTINASHSMINGCTVRNTGAGGIRLEGNNCLVVDNLIHHTGLLYSGAIALWGTGDHNSIIHNTIHHTPYSAICYDGSDTTIEKNHISTSMTELNDGGAIHITFCRNVTIRENVVIGKSSVRDCAFYLDEQTENCTVEKNLAIHTFHPLHGHMAVGCLITNNVFIDKNTQRLTFPRSSEIRFEKNIQKADSITFEVPSGEAETGVIPNAVKPYAHATGLIAMPDNIISSSSGVADRKRLTGYRVVADAPLEPVEGTVFADPCMQALEQYRYMFTEGSPAPERKIVPLDLSSTGLLSSRPD